MNVDLHCHSNASDGLLSPAELLQRARLNGVELMALTDHDTVSAVRETQHYGDELGIKVVAGIEFSSHWRGIGIHLVGLALDLDSEQLQAAIDRQGQAREERAREIGFKLEKRGLAGCYEGARAIAGTAQIGRPHFARYLVEQKMVKDFREAFAKYLGAGKPGDVKCHWPDLETVVGWIRSAGGYAVLAHPDKYKMTRTKLKSLLTEFKQVGGHAIEVVSGPQSRDITRYFAGLAADFDFCSSCGSDFHGPVSQWSDVGKLAPLPEICHPVWALWQ